MTISTVLQHKLLTVHLCGELDHHGAKPIREQIDREVLSTGVTALELDFQEVSFMDSSGIGLVMGRYQLMKDLGGALYVTNVSAPFRRVMLMAGLDRLSVLRSPERSLMYPTKVQDVKGVGTKHEALHENEAGV